MFKIYLNNLSNILNKVGWECVISFSVLQGFLTKSSSQWAPFTRTFSASFSKFKWKNCLSKMGTTKLNLSIFEFKSFTSFLYLEKHSSHLNKSDSFKGCFLKYFLSWYRFFLNFSASSLISLFKVIHSGVKPLSIRTYNLLSTYRVS